MHENSPDRDEFGLRIVQAAWPGWQIQPWMGGYTAVVRTLGTPVLHFEMSLPEIAGEIGKAERMMAIGRA
jgi:hypothetical protein